MVTEIPLRTGNHSQDGPLKGGGGEERYFGGKKRAVGGGGEGEFNVEGVRQIF